MDAFETSDLLARRMAQGRPYLEFLRSDSLSAGLYVLPAGGGDAQQPHSEDEVYVVVRGRARLRVADEDRAVSAGSVVFVAARVPHRFHAIEQELVVLVLFAPPEDSPAR